MKAEFLEEISKLNDKQQQLLKDTINYGGWGDTSMTFIDKEGNHETLCCYVYITNDAKNGKHFNGRQVSAMFRAIYKKLCPKRIVSQESIGHIFAHISDWWGDGSGDVLFIRDEFISIATEWAKE